MREPVSLLTFHSLLSVLSLQPSRRFSSVIETQASHTTYTSCASASNTNVTVISIGFRDSRR
jgi:hypothetical protein